MIFSVCPSSVALKGPLPFKPTMSVYQNGRRNVYQMQSIGGRKLHPHSNGREEKRSPSSIVIFFPNSDITAKGLRITSDSKMGSGFAEHVGGRARVVAEVVRVDFPDEEGVSVALGLHVPERENSFRVTASEVPFDFMDDSDEN